MLEAGRAAQGLRRLLALGVLDVEERDLTAVAAQMLGDRKAKTGSAPGDDGAHFVEIHQAASRSGSCSLPSMALRAWRHSAATLSLPANSVGSTGSRISMRSGVACGSPPRGES